VRQLARAARRLVVKVGSSVLTDDGAVRPRVFTELIRQVAVLQAEGRSLVIVSSGAIALGSQSLGWSHPGRSIPEKQAAAAVGQIGLVERYRRGLARRGLQAAQVLVTRVGLEDRERFLNARHTLLTLLRLGVVPIVNENDTVSTEEIRFGDNDNLSATVVNLIGADLLVLLTDVDGLYREAPSPALPRPALRDVVPSITPDIERAAQGSARAFGRGGMITKLQAVRAAGRSGAATVIANGRRRGTLLRVAAGETEGTLFLPATRMRSRKHWLAFTARPRGALQLDEGAARALRERGRSLLPAGIVEVRGAFGIGDPVSCVDDRGHELARGLVAYSAQEVERIRGLATRQIAQVLGYSNGGEVIHRDDLVLLDERT
jgi:glutamate 5-kinase